MAQTYRIHLAGVDYELPYAAPFADKVSFGVFERMLANPSDINQMSVVMAMIQLAAPDGLIAALRQLSTKEAMDVLEPWLRWAPEGEEPLGESFGSDG